MQEIWNLTDIKFVYTGIIIMITIVYILEIIVNKGLLIGNYLGLG
jgi:hypothetical protein